MIRDLRDAIVNVWDFLRDCAPITLMAVGVILIALAFR